MLERLVGDSRVVAVVCNQWGDSGKGKFSDYFALNGQMYAQGELAETMQGIRLL